MKREAGGSSLTAGLLPSASLFSLCIQSLPRKEVIQPHVPVRLPCYDFVPVADFTLNTCLPKVGAVALGAADSHDVTGGVYKARERIHRRMLTGGY